MNSTESTPLEVEEVISCLRNRWEVTYDIQLMQRGKRLYLQIMWRYLEQQSFPLDEDSYRSHLQFVLEVVNRLGHADIVREWIDTPPKKPKSGRPLSLHLKPKEGFEEFVL